MSSIALLIPAYNAARHLPRLLASAAAQTERFDEIWVYDDCSTDGTSEVAERFGARVLRGDINCGCSHGKNVLSRRTSCEWIHFHDADDDMAPNFVALARQWIALGHFDVVLFPYEEVNDETDAPMGFRRFDPDDVARDARSYAIREQINPFCGLYRRKPFLAAGGYDVDPLVLFNEDVALHIRLAFAGLSFAAETEVAIINRRRLGSMSSANGLRCVQSQYHVMRKTARRVGAEAYSNHIARKLWGIAGVAAAHLDWRTANEAAALASRLAGAGSAPTSPAFKALCCVSAPVALRIREAAVRVFRPRARIGYPKWGAVDTRLSRPAS